MWGSFACPQCHKLLASEETLPIRILRLALITGVMFYFLGGIRLGCGNIFISHFHHSWNDCVADEYAMRLFPATY